MKYLKKLIKLVGLKKTYYSLQDFFLKWRGYRLLSQSETVAFMAPYQITKSSANRIARRLVTDCTDDKKIIFPEGECGSEPVYVWEYISVNQKPRISRYGSVIINGKVLCTDRSHSSFYKNIWRQDKRIVRTAPTVIAPFSHFQEGKGYGGYFDFVYMVAVKICRIKDALPDEDFSNVIISYPSFQGAYETEYLQLLGLNPENLLDSRKYKVVSPRILTGNGRNWHPNIADVLSLKRHIQKKFQPVKTASNRIYISRASRRVVKNEAELITLLKKFDFQIIEDKNRSIIEQITIYHNASFIIGPHGASFGNIIWCEPGTHLLELFSPNYVPDFFVYLTSIMGMKYSAYYDGVRDDTISYLDGLLQDIYISIPELEKCLNKIFNDESTMKAPLYQVGQMK